MAIIQLTWVFKKLCAKIVDPTTMGDLRQDVVLTLILLEWEFPPSMQLCTNSMLCPYSSLLISMNKKKQKKCALA
jgi:hypothetical protein